MAKAKKKTKAAKKTGGGVVGSAVRSMRILTGDEPRPPAKKAKAKKRAAKKKA